MLNNFSILDWVAIGVYFLISIVGGILSTRKQDDTNEYFRASGSIPAWAAAISLLATSQSAATFIGAPQSSFKGDLAYFATNIAYVLGVVLVGYLFVPAIYKSGAHTVYGYVQTRYAGASGFGCSIAFLAGRVLASGARLFIGAQAISYVYFGEVNHVGVLVTIGILTFASLIYTYFGGVRAVIWTDVLQAGIYITVLIVALWVVWFRINLSPDKIIEILKTAGPEGTSKLNFFQSSGNYWSLNYSLFAILIGHTLIAMGAYGTDHDLVQRYMTCKDAKTGTKSAITGILVGVPIQFLFLVMGLLFFILYKKSEFIPHPENIKPLIDDKILVVHFIMNEMPSGLKGMMLAGLFAMTLASTASAFNAMSSSFVNDVVKWKIQNKSETELLSIGKQSMILFALLLCAFAIISASMMQGPNKPPLVDFAMSVMTYAYCGLLGVFFTGLFTKRGNHKTVLAALLVGFIVTFFLYNYPIDKNFSKFYIDKEFRSDFNLYYEFNFCVAQFNNLGFPWKMTLATSVTFLVCFLGKPKPIELKNHA